MVALNLPIFLFSDFGLQDPYVGQVCAFYEGELGEPVLYVHSSGYLGITMNRSNASDALGIGQGEKVSILVRGS
jgi:S-adenosylmethionine hydrolase